MFNLIKSKVSIIKNILEKYKYYIKRKYNKNNDIFIGNIEHDNKEYEFLYNPKVGNFLVESFNLNNIPIEFYNNCLDVYKKHMSNYIAIHEYIEKLFKPTVLHVPTFTTDINNRCISCKLASRESALRPCGCYRYCLNCADTITSSKSKCLHCKTESLSFIKIFF